MTERHMDQGEAGHKNEPGKITSVDKSLKYGKKTDEERFECQRYEANRVNGFFKSIRKLIRGK